MSWKNSKLIALKDITTEESVILLKTKRAKIMPSEYALSLGKSIDKIVLIKGGE